MNKQERCIFKIQGKTIKLLDGETRYLEAAIAEFLNKRSWLRHTTGLHTFESKEIGRLQENIEELIKHRDEAIRDFRHSGRLSKKNEVKLKEVIVDLEKHLGDIKEICQQLLAKLERVGFRSHLIYHLNKLIKETEDYLNLLKHWARIIK